MNLHIFGVDYFYCTQVDQQESRKNESTRKKHRQTFNLPESCLTTLFPSMDKCYLVEYLLNGAPK